MRYGSVCSGIEAASEAWKVMGWQPVFFSEIEKFPCAVLEYRHGSNLPGEPLARNGVPNLGDMTRFEEWDDYAIDLLVGGTPCQDYSIAGLRAGMAGERGGLTLTYVGILARYRPRWFVWENVPGVFSTNGGRDFARFLGDLTGRTVDVPEGGWRNHGLVTGIPDAYGVAWCVRDAQYVRVDGYERAVPQRRERVFVVGYLGDWRPAAAVLLEPEGMRGDPPPRRETGEGVAPTISARTQGGGGLGTDFDLDGGLIASEVAGALCKDSFSGGAGGRPEGAAVGHFVPVAFDCKAAGDTGFSIDEAPGALRAAHGGGHAAVAYAVQAGALRENPDSGPDGAGISEGLSYTLEARAEVQAVAYSIMPMNSGKDFKARETDVAQPLMAAGPVGGAQGGDYIMQPHAQAHDLRGREGGAQFEGPHETANIRAGDGGSSRSYVAETWAVRRLTPLECSRLQGFPDDHARIPWRGKPASQCPDGPQYKAYGNSMAINVMRSIGRRIEYVDAMMLEAAE